MAVADGMPHDRLRRDEPPFSGAQGPFAGIAAGRDGTLYGSADGKGTMVGFPEGEEWLAMPALPTCGFRHSITLRRVKG